MMWREIAAETRWWARAARHTWRTLPWLVTLYLLTVVVFVWSWRGLVAIALITAVWAICWLPSRLGRTAPLGLLEHRWRQRRFGKQVAASLPELFGRLGCRVGNEVPACRTLQWSGDRLRLGLALPFGLVDSQVMAALDGITQNTAALRTRFVRDPDPTLVLEYRDPLAAPIPARVPNQINLTAVRMGAREDGAAWMLPLRPHTLVAGCSGSGKASLVWGLLVGLAPAIREGVVEVHGIDLKSAMELGMGPALLTRLARTQEEAVTVLEEAAAAMQARARRLSGRTRQHVASVDDPHVVVLIDEMAALTAYSTDRDLLKRANAAISLLCSQGRAVGYTVFACLQDPRKETLPARGLFTQTVGLRLRDALETAMVLGEGMRDKGALCPRIPPTTPGVGYVVPDDGSDPVRVRAVLVTDDVIRRTAHDYPAPRPVPIKPPQASTASEPETADEAEESAPTRPRARRPRAPKRPKE